VTLKPTGKRIEAILFDMNGTLRMREAHEPTQRAAFARLQALTGNQAASEAYWELLTRRQKSYSRWAQENMIQLAEEEIWTRWILPDVPPERIAPHAAELTLAWSERKGRTLPRPGAQETIRSLQQRGYRLGIISNTMSSLDIPQFLAAQSWELYFEVVILSSVIRVRKPSVKPFQAAADQLEVKPDACAYVGNRVARDLVGCKQAGFALGILIASPGKGHEEDLDAAIQPDARIQLLGELLELFPDHTCQRTEA
jgi:putative hydrolase of the HAD superfamily